MGRKQQEERKKEKENIKEKNKNIKYKNMQDDGKFFKKLAILIVEVFQLPWLFRL